MDSRDLYLVLSFILIIGAIGYALNKSKDE